MSEEKVNTSDIDLEMQLLGAAMKNARIARMAVDLSSDDFSDPAHGRIWETIRSMAHAGKTANPSALAFEFGSKISEVGGKEYISELYLAGDRLGPVADRAADKIRQMALWRKIVSIPGYIDSLLKKEGIQAEEAASQIIKNIQGALSDTATGFRKKKEVAQAAIELALEENNITPTLIYEFDLLTQGGLKATRLYGIGGLYGRGKTVLLGSISENINIQEVPHLFISLETPPEDIETRNIARAMEINASSIFDSESPNHGKFKANANAYLNQMTDSTIFLHKPGANIDELERSIIQALYKYDIKGFILDYWQLVKGKERGQSENEHLQNVADRLAAICRREKIWGIVAAQLDENGNLANSPLGLKRACSLYVSLRRDPNSSEAAFITEKSNYTRLANIGADEGQGIVFDMIGPHFRSEIEED